MRTLSPDFAWLMILLRSRSTTASPANKSDRNAQRSGRCPDGSKRYDSFRGFVASFDAIKFDPQVEIEAEFLHGRRPGGLCSELRDHGRQGVVVTRIFRHAQGDRVGHAPDASEGCYYDIAGDPDPTCEQYPHAGVAFFIGFDDKGDLAYRPIDFDDPTVISSQAEAVLDYMLFVREYAEAVPGEWDYAENRFDLMADSLECGLCELYNESSDVGLLPASTRATSACAGTYPP